MNQTNHLNMIRLAAMHDGPVSAAVRDATVATVVDYRKLLNLLKAIAGLTIEIKQTSGRIVVTVHEKVADDFQHLIAMGNSSDDENAALHAILGYLRERHEAPGLSHEAFIAERTKA